MTWLDVAIITIEVLLTATALAVLYDADRRPPAPPRDLTDDDIFRAVELARRDFRVPRQRVGGGGR